LIEIYVAILALLSLGSDGTFFSPETSYELSFQDSVPANCRPANTEELASTNLGSRGKASTFNLRGFYVCDSKIFEFGDRNSFYTFVADNVAQRATEVALKISQINEQRQKINTAGEPLNINIEVFTDALPVRAHVLAVFEAALVQYAPKVKVLRIHSSQAHSNLKVVVRRVDDAKQFIGVSLSSQANKVTKSQEWLDL